MVKEVLSDEREGEGWLRKLEMARGGKASDEEDGRLVEDEKDRCVNEDENICRV